jgi:hypothetical protein
LLGIFSALAAQEYDPFERASGCMARDQASPYCP